MNFSDKIKNIEVDENPDRPVVTLNKPDLRKEISLAELIQAGADVMDEAIDLLGEHNSSIEAKVDQMLIDFGMRFLVKVASKLFGVGIKCDITFDEEEDDG